MIVYYICSCIISLLYLRNTSIKNTIKIRYGIEINTTPYRFGVLGVFLYFFTMISFFLVIYESLDFFNYTKGSNVAYVYGISLTVYQLFILNYTRKKEEDNI